MCFCFLFGAEPLALKLHAEEVKPLLDAARGSGNNLWEITFEALLDKVNIVLFKGKLVHVKIVSFWLPKFLVFYFCSCLICGNQKPKRAIISS